jgi:MGT family glycosyltransferase
MMHRFLHLCFAPPSWDGDPRVYPRTAHFIRHTNGARRGDVLPAWVADRDRRPLVYASLGTTIANRTAGLVDAIVTGLKDLAIDLLVAVGRKADPAVFQRASPNVRIEPYVSQASILEHCAAFVSHGGFNGVKESLSLAVPLVIIPIMSDQHYCAERCSALGVGRVLLEDERDAAQIRSATEDVLTATTYRERAAHFAAEIAALPPIEHAVDLLERLAQTGEPIELPAPR